MSSTARRDTGPNWPMCTIRSITWIDAKLHSYATHSSGSLQRRGRDNGNRRRQQREEHNGARQRDAHSLSPLLIYSWSPTRLLSLSPCCLCFTENRRITWLAWSSLITQFTHHNMCHHQRHRRIHERHHLPTHRLGGNMQGGMQLRALLANH